MPNDWGDEAVNEWGDTPARPAPDKRPPGLFNKALGAISGKPGDPSTLERVGMMIAGTPTTPWGEVVRAGGAKLMSYLPGRGDYDIERRRIAESEGMPDPGMDRRGYLKEGDKRFWAEAPYMALGVHSPLNVGKAGLTSAVSFNKPIFGKTADAAERSGARYMTRALHASEGDIQTLREKLSTPGGDVALDAGRVVRDLAVPSTGERVLPIFAKSRGKNVRAQTALGEMGAAIGQTVDEATTRNPRSVRVKDLLDEAAAAAEAMDTRAERAVSPKTPVNARTTAQQIIDEYMKARETAAHLQYDEPGQVEMGATSHTTTRPGERLQAGTPTNVVGESEVGLSARAVQPRAIGIENQSRVWTGNMITDPKTGAVTREMVPSQMGRVAEPGYRQPMVGERRVSILERDPTKTPRVGERGPVPTDQMEPNWRRNLTAEDADYPQNVRPNAGSAAEPRLAHAPAEVVPTSETTVQPSLFPGDFSAEGQARGPVNINAPDAPTTGPGRGEWAPNKVPGPPGPPKHVGSDVDIGPSMNPEELHALIQRLDQDVWQTGIEKSPTNPQAYIDANPELQLKQRIAGIAAEKLKEAVKEALGETRSEWFNKDMQDFSATKTASTPLKTAANAEAGGGGFQGLSPTTARRVAFGGMGAVGVGTGNIPLALAALGGEAISTLGNKYGASIMGRGLTRASKAIRASTVPGYNITKPAAIQALVQQIAADKMRKEKKNAP